MNRRQSKQRKRERNDARELAEQINRQNRTAAEQDARGELDVARAERDDARREANKEFDRAVAAAQEARTERRREIEAAYEDRRLDVLAKIARATEAKAWVSVQGESKRVDRPPTELNRERRRALKVKPAGGAE